MSYIRTSGSIIEQVTFQHQADATLNQAAPVQNTWYIVLLTKAYVRLISVQVAIAVAVETLDVRVTIDGNVLVGTQAAAVVGTQYYAYPHEWATDSLAMDNSNSEIRFKAFLFEGKNVKVEIRKTTALGAGALSGRVVWAKRQ